MRKYKVWLKRENASPLMVAVEADDVNVEVVGEEGQSSVAYWNFTAANDDGDTITLHGFPFAAVDYFISEPTQ